MNLQLFVFCGVVLGAFSAACSAACDAKAGEMQFSKCAACHSVEAGVHLMGPSLHALMGRKAGSADGFTYSDAMSNADFVWTEKALSAFIKNPAAYVAGTVMPFAGIRKVEQRDALVCYLKQFD